MIALRADETLAALLERLVIDEWDYLVFPDGSGSNFNHACGWASVTIDKTTGSRIVRCGGTDSGTVNFAELMAALHPLTCIDSHEDKVGETRPGGRRLEVHVHIITDSQYCQVTGQKSDRAVHKNVGLWAAIDQFPRKGVILHWHHIPREDCALNSYVDRLSKLMKDRYKTFNGQEAVAQEIAGKTGTLKSVYDHNPD
jgi:ribonuclease HI